MSKMKSYFGCMGMAMFLAASQYPYKTLLEEDKEIPQKTKFKGFTKVEGERHLSKRKRKQLKNKKNK